MTDFLEILGQSYWSEDETNGEAECQEQPMADGSSSDLDRQLSESYDEDMTQAADLNRMDMSSEDAKILSTQEKATAVGVEPNQAVLELKQMAHGTQPSQNPPAKSANDLDTPPAPDGSGRLQEGHNSPTAHSEATGTDDGNALPVTTHNSISVVSRNMSPLAAHNSTAVHPPSNRNSWPGFPCRDTISEPSGNQVELLQQHLMTSSLSGSPSSVDDWPSDVGASESSDLEQRGEPSDTFQDHITSLSPSRSTAAGQKANKFRTKPKIFKKRFKQPKSLKKLPARCQSLRDLLRSKLKRKARKDRSDGEDGSLSHENLLGASRQLQSQEPHDVAEESMADEEAEIQIERLAADPIASAEGDKSLRETWPKEDLNKDRAQRDSKVPKTESKARHTRRWSCTDDLDGVDQHVHPRYQKRQVQSLLQAAATRSAQASKQMVYDVYGWTIGSVEILEMMRDEDRWRKEQWNLSSPTQEMLSNWKRTSDAITSEGVRQHAKVYLMLLQIQLSSCRDDIREEVRGELLAELDEWLDSGPELTDPILKEVHDELQRVLQGEVAEGMKQDEPEDDSDNDEFSDAQSDYAWAPNSKSVPDQTPGTLGNIMRLFLQGAQATDRLDRTYHDNPAKKAKLPHLRKRSFR